MQVYYYKNSGNALQEKGTVAKEISIRKGVAKMLQKHLNVIAVGEPNFAALTDGEKQTFFETLFSRIVEVNKKNQALKHESVD